MLGLLAYSLCAYVVAAANPRLWPRPALGHASRRDVANSSVDEGDPVRCRRSMPLPRGPRSDRAPRSRLLQHPPNTRTSSHRGGCLGTARRSRGSNTTANRRKPLRATTISARRHRGGRPSPPRVTRTSGDGRAPGHPRSPRTYASSAGRFAGLGLLCNGAPLGHAARHRATCDRCSADLGGRTCVSGADQPASWEGAAGPNTEMIMSGTGPGQAVTGFMARAEEQAVSTRSTGYPSQNPGSDFTRKGRGLRRCHQGHVGQQRPPP